MLMDPDEPYDESERCCPICNALSLLLLLSDEVSRAHFAACDCDVSHIFLDGRTYCSIHRPGESCEPLEGLSGDVRMCTVCEDLLRDWAKYAAEANEEAS